MSRPYLGFDNGSNFIRTLSSFWTLVWPDKDRLTQFMSAYGETFSEAYFNFLQGILGVSLEHIPALDRRKWYFLTLSENANLGQGPITYGGGGFYGPQPSNSTYSDNSYLTYGGTGQGILFSWNLPEGLEDIDLFVMNRIHSPSKVLAKDRDFTVADGKITFEVDPFTQNFAIREIVDGQGQVTDREIGLWVLNSHWDYDSVYQNFGTLFNYRRTAGMTAEAYKKFVHRVWELYVGGPSFHRVASAINAVLGLPVTLEREEILKVSLEDDHYQVVGSYNTYNLPPGVTPSSSYFDLTSGLKPSVTLEAFDPLTDTVSLKDDQSNPGWWLEVNPLIIPRTLMNLPKDLIFPEDVIIYRDPIIGASSTVSNSPGLPETLQNFPIRFGEVTIQGDGSFDSNPVDFKDYIFRNFFRRNIAFISVDASNLPRTVDLQVFSEIIKESTPAHIYFLNYVYLGELEDEYVVDTNPTLSYDSSQELFYDGVTRTRGHNTEGVEAMDACSGIPLEETATSALEVGYDDTLTLGFEGGFYGASIVGFTHVGGARVGALTFQNNLLVRTAP